jgi:hypothetical protein
MSTSYSLWELMPVIFGAVLMQDSHPIAYLSKPTSGRNQGLSTYEKECMVILLTVENWRKNVWSFC